MVFSVRVIERELKVRAMLGLALAFCLVGCTRPATPPPERTEADKAQDLIYASEVKLKQSLKDPDSAKFQNVSSYRYDDQGQVLYLFCGEVNSKNGFGGYAGFERFVAAPTVVATEDQGDAFTTIWNTYCVNRIESVVF